LSFLDRVTSIHLDGEELALADTLPHLKVLEISGCSLAAFSRVRRLRQLEALDLGMCGIWDREHPPDTDLEASMQFAQAMSVLTELPRLKAINLFDTSLDGEGLAQLARDQDTAGPRFKSY
jgi:hypothetical protein